MQERRRVRVRGTVQGVGFRPFTYRRARELGLTGWVRNDGRGVLIEVQGEAQDVAALVASLQAEPPPLAVVDAVHDEPVALCDERAFHVLETDAHGAADVPVSADVAPCNACLTELRDPRDRRFGYPFINCTDCGPRYTIVRGVPYDRARTTMASFPMCAACRAEYDDPGDRRFHAQPNACPECGPRLRWADEDATVEGPGALAAAVARLRGGGVVALKGVGGYHLACLAGDDDAVGRLRQRKRRDDKPFAVMVADEAAARALCDLDGAACAALVSPRRPVVLAPRRPSAPVSAAVAPRVAELGVMLPSSPLHALLMDAVGVPLVMTSGNLTDEPVVHRDADAHERLGAVADGILSHDREIHVRTDDSVVRSRSDGGVQLVRRARGWVPQPLRLPVPSPRPVLAVGAQLKSTVALARDGAVVVSQHLGDLDHWPTFAAFTAAVDHLTSLSGTLPEVVAHDLHPGYRSTAWAAESGLPTVAVQHHHAHVAACLVEHGVRSPVLGVAFDGVGLGPDGTLWGGELLVADLTSARRVGHLATAPLPGGDVAVREPWRMALSWLQRALGTEVAERWGAGVDPRCGPVLAVARSDAALETSSVGRLFDAVAALLGLRTHVTYEGQAAAELESLARTAPAAGAVALPLHRDGAALDPAPLLNGLLDGLARGVHTARLAAGFHLGLADATAELAVGLASDAGLDTVALTGGVFQNALLSQLLEERLQAAGLRVLTHRQLPPNDGSVSVGQAAVAAALLDPAAQDRAVPGRSATELT